MNCLRPLLRATVALALCHTALPAPAGAQIYGGRDAEGTLVLSDFPSPLAPDVVVERPRAVEPAAWTPARAAQVPARQQQLAGLIRDAARELGVAPQLLHAVIAVESGFDARAVSPKGAMGLMQLMPATARRFNVADPFDARQNLAGGAHYLKWLLSRFDGDLQLALAAYNAGEAAVVRAGNRIPPFEETRAYVPRVLRHMQHARYD
jgi:soluble lytic murein transglycosylase-like protein